MNRLLPGRVSILALLGAGLAGAASLSTSVAAPNGSGIPNIQGTDNQIYELLFDKAGAKAQSDYGLLRASVWSNVGMDPFWNGESYAQAYFDDRLTVQSPTAGILNVLVDTDGTITYLDSIYNSQSFSLHWSITNLSTSAQSNCISGGGSANTPALPVTCDMQVALDAGSTSIYLSGYLQIYNRGMASDISMDFFHTSKVTGIGATDGVNLIEGVTVTAQSGTQYAALSQAPEPATGLLFGAGLLLLARKFRRA